VYSIGFISKFYCVVFLFFVCACVCVCVWATLPDLNKMEWNGNTKVIVQVVMSKKVLP